MRAGGPGLFLYLLIKVKQYPRSLHPYHITTRPPDWTGFDHLTHSPQTTTTTRHGTDLRDEFSIGERFAKVEHKINHVQSNTKFFLEILNHQKSNKLEWIIIVLIAAEIVIGCIDLYHQLF